MPYTDFVVPNLRFAPRAWHPPVHTETIRFGTTAKRDGEMEGWVCVQTLPPTCSPAISTQTPRDPGQKETGDVKLAMCLFSAQDVTWI